MLEGLYIEQIEEVGDGWLSGVGPGSKLGVFPYVIESSQAFEMLIVCLKLITLNLLNHQMFQLGGSSATSATPPVVAVNASR